MQSLNEDINDIAEALGAEPDRRAGRRIPATAARPHILQYRNAASCAGPLEDWIDVLGRDRIHVTIFDDFVSDTRQAYRAALDFLGVDPDFTLDFALLRGAAPAR